MMFIAEALGAWLIEQLAESGRSRLAGWLLGSQQQRALEQAASAAIQDTAWQLRPGPSAGEEAAGAEHLARVIDHVFQTPPSPSESLSKRDSLLEGLYAAVAVRLAALGNRDLTGTDQSSAELLGVSVPALAELLANRLVREIIVAGASGGSLTPLADQLNHDLTHLRGEQQA